MLVVCDFTGLRNQTQRVPTTNTHEDWLRNLAQGVHGFVVGPPFDSAARRCRDVSPQSCWVLSQHSRMLTQMVFWLSHLLS